MKIQFKVDPENIVAFSEILESEELKNAIVGTTEEDLLLIDVYYSRDKREALESLEDLAESDD
jgi:phosphoribosylformylglycinamidine (FGAM) synthase-like enzyme